VFGRLHADRRDGKYTRQTPPRERFIRADAPHLTARAPEAEAALYGPTTVTLLTRETFFDESIARTRITFRPGRR
jgi:hypothetical protein